MSIHEKSDYKNFQENVEKFLLNPHHREATTFLFRLFSIWIGYFFMDYRTVWGNVFSNEDKKDLKQVMIIKFFDVIRKKGITEYQVAKTYLLRIFQTTCIDFLREKDRGFLRLEEELNADILIISDDITDDNDDNFSISERFQIILKYWEKAINQLQESQKTIINCLLIGYPYEKISALLGEKQYSPNSFKAKVYRAKKTCQKKLLKILNAARLQGNLNTVEREIINKIITGICNDIS